MNSSSQTNNFINGLVFGFDVGTGSIGWAVRKGSDFRDVGVLICPADTNDLSDRRNRRRQRRTLRSRKYRRMWFARQLAEILGLELLQDGAGEIGLPKTAWEKNAKGGWVPKLGFESLLDPITLRVRAIGDPHRLLSDAERNKPLMAEELYAALIHLFKRRGYEANIPWANRDDDDSKKKSDEEWDSDTIPPTKVESEFNSSGYDFPCEYLYCQAKRRKRVWPRQLLKKEFEAIIAAQIQRFPKLNGTVEGKPVIHWLLYGDTREIEKNGIHHVFYKSTTGCNPGVFGLHWPRFDNRGPGLDSLQPVDEKGRPLHVVRKNKDIYRRAQWELAVENFRVLNIKGEKVRPDAVALARLHEIWLGKKKKAERDRILAGGIPEIVKISEKVLETWAEEMHSEYALIEGQEALEPATGKGRARYSSPTLSRMLAGELNEPPQPLLVRPGETRQNAVNRFLTDIKHPLVRHRLALFRKLLLDLMKRHGTPDLVIVEAVRSLAMGRKTKSKYLKELKERRDDRESAYKELKEKRQSTSKQAILRYRLWRETGSFCPFCGRSIEQAELHRGNADIAHIYPRSLMECNEFYNLTIAHANCNRMEMQNKIPRLAFPDHWSEIEQRVRKYFKRTDQQRKLQLFLSETNEDAAQLVESKANLMQTAYIAKILRRLCLIELGWTGPDGRDPSDTQGNIPSRSFLVSNGALTSRLREAWGLDAILHPRVRPYTDEEWAALSEEAKADHKTAVKARFQKNRGDNRHHALDAIVISSTLPWLAYRVVDTREVNIGEPVWWQLDNSTRRCIAHHPLFASIGEFRAIVADWMSKVSIRSYVSHSNHKQAYNTTIYAKKAPNQYVVRNEFTSLSPKNLCDIFPHELSLYCQAAWDLYRQDNSDWEAQVKKNHDCLPISFTSRLCFAHFQQWREQVKRGNAPRFAWPSSIRIPVKRVRLVSIKNDKAVMATSSGTHGFVERSSFKEVRIYSSPDKRTYEPVFIPYWLTDPLYPSNLAQRGKPVAVIRKGQLIELKKPLAAGAPAGLYRVLVMGQNQVTILPHNIANTEEARIAYGLPKTGVKPYWDELITCLSYELSHHPSDQAESASAAPA